MKNIFRIKNVLRSLNYVMATLSLGACMKAASPTLSDTETEADRNAVGVSTDICSDPFGTRGLLTTTTPYVMPDSSGQIPPNTPIRIQLRALCHGVPLAISGARLLSVPINQNGKQVGVAGASREGVVELETSFGAVANSLREFQGSYRAHFKVQFDYRLVIPGVSRIPFGTGLSDDLAITVGPCNDYDGKQKLFAKDVFRELMGRDAEDFQIVGMSQALNNYQVTRSEIALSLLRSYERGAKELNGIYLTYLGRPAEPAVLDLANPKSTIYNYLKGFVTIEDLRAGVLGSEEFFYLRVSGNNETFVRQLYFLTLGRYPSLRDGDGDRVLWELQTGQISRTVAARNIFRSGEWGALRADQWLAKVSGYYSVPSSYRDSVIADFVTLGRDETLAKFLSSGYYRTHPWCETAYY